MLVRAAKANFDGFHEAAKQLLIWTFSRKRHFHSTGQKNYDSNRKGNRDRRGNWYIDYRNNEEDEEFMGRGYDYNNTGFNRKYRRREYKDNRDYGTYSGSSRRKNSRPIGFNKRSLLGNPERNYNLEDIKSCEKNFYAPHPNVVNRPESEVRSFYEKHAIQIFGSSTIQCPKPIFSFDELELPIKAQELISDLKYSEPTPIQSQTWPVALSGLNMVGVAQTGSGKTLGFVLPGLIHINHQLPLESGEGPIALVISPTRELALQTDAVITPFAQSFLLKNACVFGGASRLVQLRQMEGAHFCVCTPGRIIDFLNQNLVNLARCTYFVLDEADRLLDMGFQPQINYIMTRLRPDAQMLMWSATWPKEVQKLSAVRLKDYIGVKFGSSELTVNPNITQRVHVCQKTDKQRLLIDLLKEIFSKDAGKILLYCGTKAMVDYMARFLRGEGFKLESITGDKTQSKRQNIISAFREGNIDILLGTNIIGRGLDISDIKNVILYDFPNELEDYVHLIGRTGRCNNKGTAHTFFTDEDSKYAPKLIHLLNECNQEVTPALMSFVSNSTSSQFQSGFQPKQNLTTEQC